MSNHLKKITARAKQIRKAHPAMKWTNAIKQASREYRGGSVGAVKKKSANRQTGTSNKQYDVKRSARPPGARIPRGGSKVTYYERRKNRSDKPGTVTGTKTVSQLKAMMLAKLKEDMGKQLLKKECATSAKAFRSAGQKIIELRKQINKIS
jgi:hypothetical protein